jgi:hypothetical protein
VKSDKRSKSTCFLCGAPATTRDHIPPIGVFPSPRPNNLITVPACANCNRTTSLNDEYFRLVVAAISQDSPQSHVLLKERILPRARNNPALIVDLLKSVQRMEFRNQQGLVQGQAPVLSFDAERIQVVIDKIVRGLFFKHTRRRLEEEYRVNDYLLNPPIGTELQHAIACLPLFKVGDGSVFSYSHHLADPATSESYWFLMFYNDTTLFVTSTSSPSAQESINTAL